MNYYSITSFGWVCQRIFGSVTLKSSLRLGNADLHLDEQDVLSLILNQMQTRMFSIGSVTLSESKCLKATVLSMTHGWINADASG
jgi:hypothetical protein